MFHIVHRTQVGVCGCTAKTGVCLELADKQQHAVSLLPVVNVSLPDGRVLCSCALALPVEQALVDGVILVHSGGRVVFVRFVQSHKENVQILVRQPLHAFADSRRFQKVQCDQQLVTGISTVQIQRTIKAHIYRFINKVDSAILIPQQCLQFTQQSRAVRKSIQIIKDTLIIQCSAALPHTVT